MFISFLCRQRIIYKALPYIFINEKDITREKSRAVETVRRMRKWWQELAKVKTRMNIAYNKLILKLYYYSDSVGFSKLLFYNKSTHTQFQIIFTNGITLALTEEFIWRRSATLEQFFNLKFKSHTVYVQRNGIFSCILWEKSNFRLYMRIKDYMKNDKLYSLMKFY